jgi:hypothetical protein
VLPVAWLVEDAERAAPTDAIARVRGAGGGVDPERLVLLSGAGEPAVADAPAPTAARAGERGSVTVAERSDDTLELRVVTPRAAYLVTSESSAPGWQATMDDVDSPILMANGGFRALRVPPGAHQARFVYRPWSVRVGLAVGVVGVLAALLLAVGARAATRRSSRSGAMR